MKYQEREGRLSPGPVTRITDHSAADVLPVFSPDGTLLAIGYVDGKIGIWNVASGKMEKLLVGEVAEVFTVAWSPDGKLVASAGLSGPIVVSATGIVPFW